MGFRQNNETNRKWNTFYQANRQLIEEIGLPGQAVDTWDRFAYLLMHGIIDYHDDPAHFNLDELSRDKLKLFRDLIERYFEAGFSDPGMFPGMVGGRIAHLMLVRRYPKSFFETYRQEAEVVLSSVAEEWWIDRSALPSRLWARMAVYGDDSAEVVDLDGKPYEFSSRKEAEDWLARGLYCPLNDLIATGDLPSSTVPPAASTDQTPT